MRVKTKRDLRLERGEADTWQAFVDMAVLVANEISSELMQMEGTPWAANYCRIEKAGYDQFEAAPGQPQAKPRQSGGE